MLLRIVESRFSDEFEGLPERTGESSNSQTRLLISQHVFNARPVP